MTAAHEMPLPELLHALSRTPAANPQLRAVLAATCARWQLEEGDEASAVQNLGVALEMVPDLRPAMRMAYRVYLSRSDVRSAVSHLDQEIRATRHPREAAALYRERGQLVEAHFGDLNAAQQCYQAALKATPRDLAVLRSVERVSLARGDLFSLIANLEAQLEVLEDTGGVAGVLRDLAMLESRHGGELDLAADMLLAALELFPRHLGVVTDLFRVAEAGRDPELMLQALEMEAEARPSELRAMPLTRASVTLREHRERNAAVALLEAAASSQPENLSLWRSLEDLSLSTGQFDVALKATLGQLHAMGDHEEAGIRSELFYRVGRVALFRLDRTPEGLSAMRRALRLFPGHVPAMEDAGRFLGAHEMWSQLLELIKLQISTAGEAGLTRDEVALAHLRAGQLLEEQLRELDGARKYYEDALKASPSFRPARDRLERILHQLGRVDDLREHYKGELKRADKSPRRVFLLSVLGQLHARLRDPSDAIKYLIGLLKEVPEHLPSLQLLARLLAKAGRPKDLLKVTAQEIRLTISAVRKAKLLHRVGELALQLANPDKAVGAFNLALEAVDDHRPSLQSLERLFRARKEWPPLLEVLRKQLLYANDRDRQVALRLELASLLAHRLGRPEDALAELEQLLARWPRHLPALHAAENLAARLANHQQLIDLLERHIVAVSGPRTRALLLHRAANVRSGSLGDPAAAIRDLVRALELWPQLGVARARLLHLYEQMGHSRELQAFAEAGLTSERGTDDRRAMALQLAELTPKAVVAIQYLGAVAEAHPEDFVTQIRLARACRQARRPGRESGAVSAAAAALTDQLPATDPDLLAMRYRAARAEEAAGNLDDADRQYAGVLDADPGPTLARRGRLRVKERKREAILTRGAADLAATAKATSAPVEQAAYLTIAAELHERRGALPQALATVNAAIVASPVYTPALHVRTRVLEQLGDTDSIALAIQTLVELCERIHSPTARAQALCRAGSLTLRHREKGEPNPRSWALFVRALDTDPGCDPAFRGLQRVFELHGQGGAPDLTPVLSKRLTHLLETDQFNASAMHQLAQLGHAAQGADCAMILLERGVEVVPEDSGLRAELGQVYAQLDRWDDAVASLEAALSHEQSPERRACLHYFAGEACSRAAQPQEAIQHLIHAGRGGFHSKHALLWADRLAAEHDSLEPRVEALQLLVDLGEGTERIRSLRALADLHRQQLGNPEVAVELMRELLLLRPTDIDVLGELRRLLTRLGRRDEATATLLAGVAHHRAWLRSQGLTSATVEVTMDPAPVEGLYRLFDAMAETDGVYVAAAILEVAAPELLPGGRGCDHLVSEPWPLPRPQEGRPLGSLVGDLPNTWLLDLLREGVAYLTELPGAPPPAVNLAPQHSLPTNTPVAMVVRALSNAIGAPEPLVFVNPKADNSVTAYLGTAPCLVVGRRINAAPFAPISRDLLGRALLRLITGGDFLHRNATDPQLLGLLVGIAQGAGAKLIVPPGVDQRVAAAVADSLPDPESLPEIVDLGAHLAETLETLDASTVREALGMAEDRTAVVCAADPRPALAYLRKADALTSLRGTILIGYLLSDDHLSLRRSLGYHAEIELSEADMEEM